MFARLLKLGLVALLIAPPSTLQATATIIIVNNDGAGEGFNDPTPAAPVGGNPGPPLASSVSLCFKRPPISGVLSSTVA
jgi:hypothetical protein